MIVSGGASLSSQVPERLRQDHLDLKTSLAPEVSRSAAWGSLSSAGRHPGLLTCGLELALGLNVSSDPA